jgi:hypothetical protein
VILSGEVVLNAETRAMVRMVRSNRKICRDIADMLAEGIGLVRAAEVVKVRVTAAVQPCMVIMDEFTRSAVKTALRQTVNWQSVVQLSQVHEEEN